MCKTCRTLLLVCLLAGGLSLFMLAGVAEAAGPAYTTAPSISGTAKLGQALSVASPADWTDSSGTPSITDAWAHCSGSTCTPIGATGGTYTLVAGDIGQTMGVVETATAPDGQAVAYSNLLGPVAGIVALTPPSIPGTPQQGVPITATPGTWNPAPSSTSYEWFRCDTPACNTPVGSGQTYAPTAADVGLRLAVVETATDAQGDTASANSSPSNVVVPPAPTSTYAPGIAGTFQQGQTLSVQPADWTTYPSSPTKISDVWYRCDSTGGNCAPVTTGSTSTYTLTSADVGNRLKVLETASNAGGSNTLPSALTGVIAPPPPAPSVPQPGPLASTTVLVASPSAPLVNQTVTLVATVIFSSGNANAAGTVTFLNGAKPAGGCPEQRLQARGQSATALCQVSFPAGTAALSAVFTPDAGAPVAGSASTRTALVVGTDQTSTSLAVTKQVVRGKRAIYKAQVVLPVSNSGPLEPTGSIAFLDGGKPIASCLSQPLSPQGATCTVKYRSAGKHKISAAYSGDSNFNPSTSGPRSVKVVASSTAPIVLGFITSTLQWRFAYHPAYTQVMALTAEGVVRGMTVLITCQGGGCPFSKLALPARTSPTMNLLPAFRHHHLQAGAVISLRLTRPHRIGKYYSFTIRRRQAPLIVLSCLGVGRTRPGVGC
jgi:hypothetical protein